jgi:hypothetical protein
MHSIILQNTYFLRNLQIFLKAQKNVFFGGGHSPKFYYCFFYEISYFSENLNNKLLSQPQVLPSPAMET